VHERGAQIDVRGLRHAYPSPAGALTVLDGVDLHVAPGGYASLQGPSGAGKSTLLSLLGGLERPQQGRAVVADIDLTRLSGDGLAGYRRSCVGFVFQHFGLLDTLTALENVELACTLAGERPRARRRRAAELLESVGLEARARHRPGQLAGGQ